MCLASYCDLEFCVERAICVLVPFRALTILTRRLVYALWMSIVICPSLFIALFAFYMKDTNSTRTRARSAAFRARRRTRTSSHGNTAWPPACASTSCIRLLALACNVLILHALQHASVGRTKLTLFSTTFSSGSSSGTGTGTGTGSASAAVVTTAHKEINATVTLVLLTTIQVVLYFAAGVSCVGVGFCYLHFQSQEVRLANLFDDLFVELGNLLALFNSMTPSPSRTRSTSSSTTGACPPFADASSISSHSTSAHY